MKNGQRRPIGHPTSLSAIASIVQAGNFLLIFEGETVRVQGQRKTSEKFDHQTTAVALITGTPKSEVHKVNQRKLISVLEVRGCNKGSSRLLQNQKSNQLPQRKKVRAFRLLCYEFSLQAVCD